MIVAYFEFLLKTYVIGLLPSVYTLVYVVTQYFKVKLVRHFSMGLWLQPGWHELLRDFRADESRRTGFEWLHVLTFICSFCVYVPVGGS